jgi:hypothetical protein
VPIEQKKVLFARIKARAQLSAPLIRCGATDFKTDVSHLFKE